MRVKISFPHICIPSTGPAIYALNKSFFFFVLDRHVQETEQRAQKENRDLVQAGWTVLEGQGPGCAYMHSFAPAAERSNGMQTCRELSLGIKGKEPPIQATLIPCGAVDSQAPASRAGLQAWRPFSTLGTHCS